MNRRHRSAQLAGALSGYALVPFQLFVLVAPQYTYQEAYVGPVVFLPVFCAHVHELRVGYTTLPKLSESAVSPLLMSSSFIFLFTHRSGRASVALHTEMYFANNPTEEDAFVMSVDKSKVSVIVPRFGIEGSVSGMFLRLRLFTRYVFYVTTFHHLPRNKHARGHVCRSLSSFLFRIEQGLDITTRAV